MSSSGQTKRIIGLSFDIYRVCALVVVFFCCLGTKTNAQALEVFADHSIYHIEQDEIKFSNNVKVLFRGAKMTSDHLDANLQSGQLKLNLASAYGNLKISNDTESATAKRAIYNSGASQITLLGEVEIVRQGVVITAEKYMFDIGGNKSTILSEPKVEDNNDNGATNQRKRVKIKIDNHS